MSIKPFAGAPSFPSINKTVPVTVLIPAFNEADSIGDTIRSVQAQTMTPTEIIVIDDCSTDGTGAAAQACGVKVVRPPANTGSKAGAQTFALPQVQTEFTVPVSEPGRALKPVAEI